MLIKVSDIPPEGIIQGFCDAIEVPGIAMVSPVCGQLLWRRLGRRVIITGTLQGTAEMSCGRCLVPFRQEIATEVFLEYLPSGEVPTGDERELVQGELDVGYFSGDIIDTREIVGEQMLLNVPMSPVCREDCRGICPRCGTDLNEKPCDCGEQPADTRFSVLAKLKDRG